MDQHNLNINSLEERNMVSMPLTVVLNVEDAAAATMVTAAEAEDKEDMVDVAIRGLPQLTASMHLIPIALLLNRNGIHLVLGNLLSSNYVRTDKDMDLEEAMTRLAVGMEMPNMIMNAILLLLTVMTHLTKMTTLPLIPPLPTTVAAMDVVLDAVPIQTTALDSLGHWQ